LFQDDIPEALEKSSVILSLSDSKYISRPDIESKISRFLDSPNTKYCIVYGVSGVGKSEVVDHTVIGRRAVVKVSVYDFRSRDDLVASVISRLTEEEISLTVDNLIEAMKKCKANGVVPTIIFDVEDFDKLATTLSNVKSLAKALIGYCKCIIVLPDTKSILEFGKDREREEYIFVDELTIPEAKHFMHVRGATFNEDEMQYIFDHVGTRASLLINLMSCVKDKNMPIKTCVENVLNFAGRDLFLFQIRPILDALKEHSEGVDYTHFIDQKFERIPLANPRAVSSAADSCNTCLLYRIENGTYQLQSTAHKTMLKSYSPQNIFKKYLNIANW
jgi:hypothetical protein